MVFYGVVALCHMALGVCSFIADPEPPRATAALCEAHVGSTLNNVMATGAFDDILNTPGLKVEGRCFEKPEGWVPEDHEAEMLRVFNPPNVPTEEG